MAMRTSFALLIDSDNVSAKYIGPILNELAARHGQVTYRRIYGDWTSPQMAKWRDVLVEHSLTPMQQFPNTVGKNATDSFLIIDAMDILHEERVGGFCIVSSDSDFARLASRLRDAGKVVVGMGEKKTPPAFRNACTVFTSLEMLLEEDNPLQPAGGGGKATQENIRSAVIDMINENGAPVSLSEVGSRLVRIHPDFDVRSFGYSQLSRFLESVEGLSIIQKDTVSYVGMERSAFRYENAAKFVRETVEAAGKQGVALSSLGVAIREKYKSFDMKEFGYTKFSEFVRSVDGVKVDASGDRARIAGK